MKQNINQVKNKDFLNKIGKTLQEQRTIVSKKSFEDFALIMSEFSGIVYTPEKIKKMEEGNGKISIIYWTYVWQYFQNIDRILNAYNAKEMMYLAQQEFLPEIEQEILAHNNKRSKNEK